MATIKFEGASYVYDETVATSYDFNKAVAYIGTGEAEYQPLFYDAVFEQLFGERCREYWDGLGGDGEAIGRLLAAVIEASRTSKN